MTTDNINSSEYFSMEDFNTVKKIDAHLHLNADNTELLKQAENDNWCVLTINVDVPSFIPISDQQDCALKQKSAYPGRVSYVSTFKMEGWDKSDWQDNTIKYIEESVEKGAVAVKVWKNIGMAFTDKDGRFVMIDDPKFDPVFQYLTEQKIPLVGHIGDPKSCWLPLDKMIIRFDREYFVGHPEYHMYLHPEYPSYDDLINARDNMLRKHPNLTVIGCHLASLEWSLDELGKRFDEFPNLSIDTADRIAHLGILSQRDYQKLRDFVIKYQDRIIFGTDFGSDWELDKKFDLETFKSDMHKRWMEGWEFFTTDNNMTVLQLDGEFKGLKLPKTVIEKIFRTNAEKSYPGIFK